MKKNIFLFTALFIITFSNCSKYEDGPLISLRGKENRITNSWAYKSVTRNGVNVMEGIVPGSVNYTQSSIGFSDEERFTEIITIDDLSAQKDGMWRLEEDKSVIQLNFDDNSENRQLRILKLKKNELRLVEVFGDNTIEYHLTSSH